MQLFGLTSFIASSAAFGLVIMAGSAALPARAESQPQRLVEVVDGDGQRQSLAAVAARLSAHRAVLVGEIHDRYDHHLNQLAVVQALHEQQPGRWAVGLEFFQRPFQPYLDAYIDGTIDEAEFLTKTEYFERWSYDYRLYRPIFNYARAEKIPLLALNAERELTSRIGEVGLDGLNATERERLPQHIDQSDDAYRARLKAFFEMHPGGDFQRFWEVQLTWDETMADTAAKYLLQHPDKAMVVLAGRGHIEHRSGIPNRLQRRLPDDSQISVFLPGGSVQDDRNLESDADFAGADFLLLSERIELPPTGKMGVMLGLTATADAGVNAEQVLAGGAAEQAGLQSADLIVAIGGQPVQSLSDVRLALLDKLPGDQVTVRVRRQASEELAFELELQP